METFYSDNFIRNAIDEGVLLHLDVRPQWHNDIDGSIHIVSAQTGRNMSVKMKTPRGNVRSHPVIVHSYTLRVVLAGSILGKTTPDIVESLGGGLVEDLGDVVSHANRVTNL